ncbi:unnamed protein product [Rhodiola kirilowii]
MKSSSSSSSPSSSPYFYSQRSRCIFSMLRRILCLPTRDHTSSSSSSAAKDDDSIVTMEEKTVPGGLVARLMGLDSMPNKITRSRSLNSVVQNEPKRTRSKSSRESTYIELLDIEDDKFIVLSFHNRPHNNMRSNRDKTIPADAEAVKKQDACNQENSSSKKQIRLVKKKKKKKTESSSNSDSDESSPISVFDFQQSQQGSETATPTSVDDDDSWTRSSNSSRVSTYSSPEQDISIDQQKHAANKKTKAVVVVVNGQKKNREMWGRVCDITVAEINKGTAADWVDQDLAAEFEVHIMDQLFNELLLH